MCRYGFSNYKQIWSCFACRKSFKKTNFIDYLSQTNQLETYRRLARSRKESEKLQAQERYGTTEAAIEAEYYQKISICPDCGGPMANMGMDFKSPKMSDTRVWKIIAGMHKIGAIFQTCGCEGIGFVPASRSEYIAYLQDKIDAFSARMRQAQEDAELNAYQRSEQVSYWEAKRSWVAKVLEAV